MAKEESGDQNTVSDNKNGLDIPSTLQQLLRGIAGLTITVEQREEPVLLKGGVISEFKDGGAWIMFKHDGCMLRVDLMRDRQRLIDWIQGGRKQPFSTQREYADRVGPPNVTFRVIYGTLSEPAKPAKQEKKKGMVSRAHARARQTAIA